MRLPHSISLSALLHGALLAVAFLAYAGPATLQAEREELPRIVKFVPADRPVVLEPRPLVKLAIADKPAPQAERSTEEQAPEARPEPKKTKPRPRKKIKEPKVVKKAARVERPKPTQPAPIKEPQSQPEPTPQVIAAKSDAPEATPEQLQVRPRAEAGAETSTVSTTPSAPAATRRAPSPAKKRAGAGRKSDVDKKGLARGYWKSVNRFVQRKYDYPAIARRSRTQGTVWIEIVVDDNGRILSHKVLRSSGHRILDRAALKSIAALKRIPKPPEALNWSRRPIRIPFRYRLRRG